MRVTLRSTSPITRGRERMSWFRKPSSTPLWRDEFSVHTADEQYVNRRQFTKFLTLTSFGMFVGNLWIWAKALLERSRAPLASERSVVVARSADIAAGGVKLFRYPTAQDACIMVRKPDGKL